MGYTITAQHFLGYKILMDHGLVRATALSMLYLGILPRQAVE
jgi:hypothetical protein